VAPRVWHHVGVPDPQASSAPVDTEPGAQCRAVAGLHPHDQDRRSRPGPGAL